MNIDKNLKEEFVEFCETKNGGKVFVSNLMKKRAQMVLCTSWKGF